jgi:acyl dehydratase
VSIDSNLVGESGETVPVSWTSRDAMLYALAVGAGRDPADELEFTTENSTGITQRVLPSFACVAGYAPMPAAFEFDPTALLHADMGFDLLSELTPDGSAYATATITGVYDKGSGALVHLTTEVSDSATGTPLARLESGLFIRGAGGFGGERGTSPAWSRPEHDPGSVTTYQTRPEQALLYRLTGDRNPLHSDPKFALRAGFAAPILHGMCTYGFAARALLHEVAGSDPSRFGGMYARFNRPVTPSEELTVQIWRTSEGALFRALDTSGEVVLDHGRMSLR